MTQNMHVYSKFTDMFKYLIKGTYVLQKLLFLVVLLTVGVTSAWAQDPEQDPDYSGVYYIGSVNYNATKTTTNYYLCPTEEWCYYKAENDFWPNTTEEENKTMPFLTTYQCRNGEYDASKAVWVISKAPNSDYYYIKHKSTGKYLVSNGQIAGTTNANRMRVHLETIAQENLNDKELFSIELYNTWLVISPKSSDGWNGNYKWYTVNGGNQNFLVGKGKDGGPKDYTETGGILGTYTKDDANAKFYLEDYIQKPTIFYNTDNQIEITVQADATIIYTTDGSDPTDPTNSNRTVVNSNTTTFPIDEIKTIKAVAVVEGFLSKEIAVFTPPVLLGNTNKYLIQSQNNGWTIDESTTDFHFYMVPGDKDNNNYLRVTTTSLFRPSMEWYFKGAGMENGAQFYYIVNNKTGDYLCYENNAVYMTTGSTDDKFKFKISASSEDASSFNITPYALRTAGTGTNRFINRTGTNGFYGNDTNSKNPLNLDKNDSPNTRWKFVLPSTLDTEAPFTVSDNTKASYYKIGNVGASGYYIIPPTGTGNATVSNSEDPEVIKTMNWYFEEVSAPSKSPIETGYYHIRNAITGDYLYFTKNKNNDGACLATSSTITAGNEDRYQFIWAKTADANVNYYIIPKLLKDVSLNQFSTLRKHDNNTSIITNTTRGAGNFAWSFVSTPFCFDPVITQAVDGTRTVTITCPTPGVNIYYTTDGSEPTTSSTLYEGPFVPADNVDINQIKAIAVNVNDNNAQSEIVNFDLPKYTYHIVNDSKGIAASSSAIQQAAGTPLRNGNTDANDDGITDGYNDIPEGLRSPYISDEKITFYTMEGEFNAANLDDEHIITETPAETANIYVTYSTDKLDEKFVKLSGSSPFNISQSSSYLYDTGSAIGTDSEYDGEKMVTKPYLWYFFGKDPYNLQIRNSSSNKYMTTSSSVPTRSDDPVSYILTSRTTVDATHEQITLKNLANNDIITMTVNSVVLPISYTLIDRGGLLIEANIDYVGAEGFGLPSTWKSPLVDYHYWSADAFTTLGTPDVPFVFKTEPAPTEITSATQVADDNVIYVTYTLKSDNTIDLDGRNLLNPSVKKEGITYMLQFQTPNTDEYKFYQEDGKDGVMAEKRRAVYPYSNGDAALYVYGTERWNAQLESGASTRTRWLWYLEPSTSQLDPYHVKISSYQTQTSYKIDADNTRNFHSYLRTYKPTDYDAVVTGVTNDNPLVKGGAESAPADNSLATEYMLLGTSLSSLKLVTTKSVEGGATNGDYGTRQTVTSFEQYWKNSPTVQGKLTTNKVTAVGRGVELTDDQKTEIKNLKIGEENLGWHVYKAWANSAPWVHNHDEATTGGAPTTSKKFMEEEHVFQTISMGDGSFQLVPTELKPMLILLDQHGWEIARVALPSGPDDPKRAERYREIHKYSSPMVARYHFWKTGTKIPGYHKFKVSDYATVSDTDPKEYTADELGRADLANSKPNLPNYESQALVSGRERDWYVTYDVKPEYANLYAGADTEEATSPSPFLIKQNGKYAQYSGSGNTFSLPTEVSDENIPESMQWYLRPNFNIDKEMGYLYLGETGAEAEAKSKEDTEKDYCDNTRDDYVSTWSNGFDPYNVQIQNVSNTNRYFTANTDGSTVGASWSGTSTAISLENRIIRQSGAEGHDNVKLNITNATFMVVDDGHGNMRLMPRFDNTKVMQSFTTLATPAGQTDVVNKEQIFTITAVPTLVHNSSEIAAMGGVYILADDFTASGSIGTRGAPFKGTIEGRINQSFSVSAPFIAFAEDAVIKNVIIESATVSGDTVGAIVNQAKGNTRIYNCGVNGGTVGGTDIAGSIVGHLDGYSRVINCYSYADIKGGSYVGGIVGYNNYLSSTLNEANIHTMVMNCMFYGDITGGSDKAPIYNGFIISNKDATGLGNYNYFLAEKPYVQDNEIDTYNCALMAETRFLQHFEFYRLLLNSHLELAAWYATGSYNNKDEMMKWVLETADRSITDPKPYPILKAHGKYPSIINYDAENAKETGERNTGKKLGTLSVTISTSKTEGGQTWPAGATVETTSLTLVRTDKDYDHFNFNYDKVQLPYYNDVGTGNYTKNRVVTGWKITSITGGTAGSYTTGADATTDADGNITSAPYNFADRNCTNKDLYSISHRVFNQGAYWDVPKGVTGITIEPYWAEAVYLADAYPDVVYNQSMDTKYDVPYVGGGEKYKNGSKYNIAGDSQEVYTSMDEARKKITTGKTVYDCAIVLVGNAHNIGVPSAEGNRSYTIMSADFDHDNEPDYSYILRFNDRTECHPVRTDFVNIPGLGMAQKSTGGTGSYNFGILIPKGWFESTNTSLFRFTQFEYEHKDHPTDAPLILQGGVMEQWVSNNQKGTSNNIPYIHVGGNVWFKEFHTGCHQDKQIATKHSPISVTGGDYDEFYLTGLYRGDVDNKEDNAECYINGGRFGTVCGAAMEGIGKANGANNTGNIVWQIQNADIREFYAGGLNAAKPVTGNLSTTITDSYVDIFCGGPKFGDMSANKTVHTNATGCTFGTYFGAGYGGNSYSRYAPANQNNKININWNNWLNGQYKQEYNATYGGVSTQFTYQFLPMSNNTQNVARILIDFVKFSLATTRNVTSNLTGCTVTGNFYGGGSLGKVDGNVTSTLNNCKVKGSAFGAGFSASLPTVEVDSLGFRTEPLYYESTGTYRTGVKGVTTTYTWQQANTVDKTANAIDKTNHILYTTEDLNTLGTVTGKATLNITGNTLVEGFVFDASGNPTTQTGGVFGGGDASAALGDTEVNISASGQKAGSTYNTYNVFGGGNVASVGGSTEVNVTKGVVQNGVYGGCNAQGTIGGNTTVTLTGGTVGTAWGSPAPTTIPDRVFGGGLGEPTLVSGDVIVNVGKSDHSGAATIWGNIYGGSALGNTNATRPADALVFGADKTTNVNLYAGTINGNVFGGGLGRKAVAADAEHGIEAVTAVESFVGGDVYVTLDGAKVKQVFGCNNLNGTPKGHVKVWVKQTNNFTSNEYKNTSTTPLANRTTYDVEAVYGGGNQADYNPTKATGTDDDKKGAYAEVLIEGCALTSIADVYGGGNAAAVPATKITINSAYIIDRVFGGGNGDGDDNPGADVGVIDKELYAENKTTGIYGTGIAETKLVGGQVHYVYGGSNTKGNVRGGTTLERKESNPDCELKIGEIYGAGQVAPMDGDVNIILECMPESFVEAVYGGAKNAVVNGNVSLTVTSGKYGRVFGGNNEGGSINGSITVNAYEDGCKPLIIGELYGGGFKAPYSIYGCTQSGDTWTANESGDLKFDQEAAKRAAVEVNVYSCTSIGKVFGGGYQAPVIGNTHVYINMMKGLVDDPNNSEQRIMNPIGKIGQVFGGGNEADVKGNTLIDIGTATVYKRNSDPKTPAEDVGVNIISGTGTTQAEGYLKPTEDAFETLTAGIYGGGNAADVEGNTTLNIGTAEQKVGDTPSINIQADIFGGGFGETTTVTGDVTVNIGKRTNTAAEGQPASYTYEGYANITGNVYGGSAKGKVNATKDGSTFSANAGKATQVNLYGGTITGNIYGGGLGEAAHAADVYGPVTVNVHGGKVDNVFGCNNVLGSPQSTATVNIHSTPTPEEPATYIISNVYGGGNMAAYTGTGGVSVIMTDGYVNDVYGGGLGTSATVNGNTTVTLDGGTVKHDIYGGGSQGNVTGAVSVALNGGTVENDVYGGGALALTNTAYDGSNETYKTYVTNVTLAGATVTDNIYGGGLGQLAAAAVGTPEEPGYVAAKDAVAANVTGPVKVVVTSGKVANVFGCNNVNGAPQSTVDVEIGTKTGASAPYTYGGTAAISGSVYGGGNMAACDLTPVVKLYGGTIGTNVYGGGLGSTAVTGGTSIAIEGGTVNNDVYGGGSQADVKGSVAVTVSGGTVKNDVYGGGALANTNTDNWNTPGSATDYVEVTGLNEATYYNTVTIPVGESVVGYYTYNGSAYVDATGDAVKDVTYYQRLTGAPIAGYYTKEGDVYTLQPSGTATPGTTYYKRVVVGSWVDGKNSDETGTVNKTTVILTGGSVGNVYGGGLGNSATAANVYGDVKVTVNKPEELTSTRGTGIAFSHKEERVTFGGKEYLIPLTGRVFGCNNINGTPTGNVRVEVYSTRQADVEGRVISNSEHSPNSDNNRYEIQGVYGGGNLSDYLPATGKSTSVYVDGCNVTSIEKVYGGGNSASVPSSHVTVNGSYDIGYAFGGGNGGDLVKKDGTWYENDGAIVIGTAHIAPIGGKIGAVFGGSDAKGNCGSVEIDKSQTNEDCALKIIRMYGAGNEADVDNVNIIISSCSEGSSEAEIEYVYGGSYNANVAHDVTLTITAGKFKNIYGGNDRTGSIGGNITVNIEETDDCMPITIQNLLGGGYQAPYPGTTRDGTEIKTPGKITVNVKSATHIDNIYGGSFKADVNGDTEVNINMTKGYFAGKTYSGEAIADDVGTIGNVYGGGNQGVVRGNATVNIGTASTVGYVTEPKHLRTEPGTELPKTDGLYVVPVVGARITGDVFGGGNEANVNSSTAVNIGTAVTNVSVGGSVYGGGSQADVLKNTNVTMAGGYVFDGVYGGGLHGSVGTVTTRDMTGHTSHEGCVGGRPTAFAANTGKCTVVISGGQVGPKEVALADGGMKNTARYFKDPNNSNDVGPVDVGFVFGAGRGEVENPATDKDADFHTFVKETYVTISGGLVMASVYGGGENGRVANDTHVTISGGQIGCGEGKVVDGKPVPYTEAQWTGENASDFKECASWDYGEDTNDDGKIDSYNCWPYDPYASNTDPEARKVATDGHTYYGSVFGGGSGYFPYEIKSGTTVTGHEWLRSAGQVYGNTNVTITGGHILTSVYGGNETTDVGTYTNNDKGQPLVRVSGGKCTINMTGGTIGVPRTVQQMKDHPVTCYLFGAGKGDQRTHFNTWTNVQETEVNVSGTARIFGSVFGGGEDGHVLGNAAVNIGDVTIDATSYDGANVKIGTTGTSYVDGNVFGGGRGFSGEALTAGSVHGNIELTINDGTMLGSVYGGGRLASVGIDMVDATLADGSPNPAYGLLNDDTDSETCGHITVSITGGTIGNDVAGAEYGGNVFGGSMGRLTLLDGTTNPQWPKLAASKLTNVTISGGTIKRNVYGGSEYGIVRNRATVNVSGGTINGSVFGSGRGSENTEKQTIAVAGYDNRYYTFTPMLWAGCVSGSTFVNISGGTVKKNVYGGGELASVGLIDFVSDASGKFTNMTKHESLTNGFGLSWPYEFHYHAAAPSDLPAVGGKEIGGKATVTIIGGKIGDASDAESGYVFGGGMGKPMERYTEAFMANVRETKVTIDAGSNTIYGAVYGGGENGHVYENADVKIKSGTIRYSVYGGGKGIDKYKATLKNWKDNGATTYETDIYSITAGKVYGNTSVTMSGGHVMRNVYGGGYMASVGKGNYAGGADDYSDFTSEKFGHMCGYGEAIEGNLWDGKNENSKAFLSSGKAKVYITGGTVGTPVGTAEDEFGGLPTGNVIGGSKGEPAPNVFNMPVHEYNPTFHVGNINEAEVIIGDSTTTGVGPRIFASVYGGGQDGHMRRDSKVTIYGGEIGLSSSDISSKYANNGTPANTLQWEHRGNVYGSGSGIGKFEYDYNGNGTTSANQYYEFDSDGDGTAEKHYEVGMSHLAGCVARFSEVNILGGTIHRSVYGGGSVAGTGMPKFYGQNYEPYKKGDTAEGHGPGKQSQNTVTISGGTIGQEGYGGNVFGASRGEAELVAMENPMFATAIWTEVNIKPNATNRANDPVIAGNVYGGGELGSVKKDTEVSLTGGEIKHNAYGGGKGIKADVGAVEANIGGNTTVELNKGVADEAKGCIVSKVFGCNDQNGTPKGHVLVHVYATQHKNQLTIGSKYKKFDKLSEYTVGGDDNYSTHVYDGKKLSDLAGDVSVDISAYTTTLSSGSASAEEKTAALANMIEAIADEKYDVQAVYGGGDLADYVPAGAEEETEVIIDGCELTSIKQVYGGSNAASTPATSVRVNAAYEIHELFGGGNGYDNYQIDDAWYQNPGANVGYRSMSHYDTTTPQGAGTKVSPYTAIENDGTGGYLDARKPEDRRANYAYGLGVTRLEVTGGRVHKSYGGSNENGNIRSEARSAYQEAGVCEMLIDETTGGSKNSTIDARIIADMDCVDFTDRIFGGSTNADVYSDIVLNITNGTLGEVYGGNNTSGKIYGSITVNVRENGCKPIIIGELYGGGYKADYSIYGYNDDGSVRTKAEYEKLSASEKEKNSIKRDPQINVISATRINSIFGGGNQAKVVGSPRVNVNMEKGRIIEKYMTLHPEYATANQTDTRLGEGSTVVWRCEAGGALPIGTIGTVYGGGNLAQVDGDTYVEIGTGTHHTDADADELETITPSRDVATITGSVFGGGLGESAIVTGNTSVTMGGGASVYDRIYGGGSLASVGTVESTITPDGHTHAGVCIGKPTAFAENTGTCNVTITGGYVGPFTLVNTAEGQTITPKPMHMKNVDSSDNPLTPDDYGHVFGAGRGDSKDPVSDPDIAFKTYVKESRVTIRNGYKAGHDGEAEYITRPLIAGSVYGGSENGHVLANTYVTIEGGQIGLGEDMTAAYADADFIDPATATASAITAKAELMPECAHWTFGSPWLPYDEHATDGASSKVGSDGHTFYGNVFGGGSGYYPYKKADNSGYEWLESSGLVEGNTHVTISGGHILTNIYGGNEMTTVKGNAEVTFGGTATLGVPRTLTQIKDHPLTCYLFGAGKGDQRTHFNKRTNVENATVTVNGGIIYGSVFGGGEDGHVLGDVSMTISNGTIGTWGTSYVEGNVFGAGRGFSGEALTAGVVCGNVNMNISGGTMLGSIYGGGRLGSVGTYLASPTITGEAGEAPNPNYGAMIPDGYDEDNMDTEHIAVVQGETHGYVTINISGGTIGNNNEYIIPQAGNIPSGLGADPKEWTADNWKTWKSHNNVPNTTYDTKTGRLLHAKGGNVYAGGMGRYYQLDGEKPITVVDWKKLGSVKSTSLTISDDAWIMGSVYGGGELGAVTPYRKDGSPDQGGTTTVTVTGGTIGTEVTGSTPTKETVKVPGTYPAEGNSNVKYTFGSVYGGGMGMNEHDADQNYGGDVHGSTTVSVSGADTKIRASVYGGGEMAIVGGNTTVTVSGGEIGRNEVKAANDADAGYVMFGGTYIGNVYGGGKGELGHTNAGLVKGNTNVTVSGGNVYHNIYGGGALASVGTFSVSDGGTNPTYIPISGVPYNWTNGTGTATVTITGGTIGISGRDNGLVFGSSRGGLTKPEGSPAVDPYDRVAWVSHSVVNIGTEGKTVADADYLTTPLIKGSVYGGGENGHNETSAKVNVYSGTIGVSDVDDPWYSFTDKTLEKEVQSYRGNVYGAGSGSDTYTDGDKQLHNPKSGMVGGNATVNIAGGHVGRCVYGAGAMASVGTITAETKHDNAETGFALSWPYAFTFADGTGTATVNITGGHIGTRSIDGGDVFGSARGEAGDRYDMANLAYAKETVVKVTYPETIDPSSADIANDFKTQCITGSVHGSGENGYVYGDTHVTLNKGLVGHSLYGAGKGNGTYTKSLNKIGGGGTYDAKIYSLIAGRVMGNTYVTMNGGRVLRNVYGGGNLGSVGKGNFASGADDYFPTGYGEKITGNLWTSAAEGDNAWHFLNSGKTTVKVLGGTVGTISTATKNGLPYGNVFGGSAGEAAPNVPNDLSPRYEYCPAFYSGYVNETDVTIGKQRSDFTGATADADYAAYTPPVILGSVYGGGQDGHVRRDTKITMYAGEIGLPYTSDNQTALGTTDLNNIQWLHRGNIYGAGSGINEYKFDFDGDGNIQTEGEVTVDDGTKYTEQGFSTSSGSVTRFTEVNVLGGTVHRNVYGGGSMGSVGAPKIGQDYDPYKKDLTNTSTLGKQSQNTVNIGGAGQVVNIGTPTNYDKRYGGEVYGACRGKSDLDPNQFANSVWTLVNIWDGANIMGNVYGGGDSGIVKKDSEVKIGGEKE